MMPLFCPNLSMLFTEVPFLERFALAKAAGFSAVEFQFPYAETAESIRQALDDNGLRVVLFNLPAGNWEKGDRGIAAIWDRRAEFQAGLKNALHYARVLRPTALNCLAGIAPDDPTSDLALLQNVRIAAETLGDEDLTLLVEPVNNLDVPDFALPTARAALDVIAELERDNLKLQLDVYHASRMREDPIAIVREHAEDIGHIQIADDPGRHEPGSGDIDFQLLFRTIDESGYRGYIGLEFIPTVDTQTSLHRMSERGLLR